jgi:hypothetical protein
MKTDYGFSERQPGAPGAAAGNASGAALAHSMGCDLQLRGSRPDEVPMPPPPIPLEACEDPPTCPVTRHPTHRPCSSQPHVFQGGMCCMRRLGPRDDDCGVAGDCALHAPKGPHVIKVHCVPGAGRRGVVAAELHRAGRGRAAGERQRGRLVRLPGRAAAGAAVRSGLSPFLAPEQQQCACMHMRMYTAAPGYLCRDVISIC